MVTTDVRFNYIADVLGVLLEFLARESDVSVAPDDILYPRHDSGDPRHDPVKKTRKVENVDILYVIQL